MTQCYWSHRLVDNLVGSDQYILESDGALRSVRDWSPHNGWICARVRAPVLSFMKERQRIRPVVPSLPL